jgi:hypothetical protein
LDLDRPLYHLPKFNPVIVILQAEALVAVDIDELYRARLV